MRILSWNVVSFLTQPRFLVSEYTHAEWNSNIISVPPVSVGDLFLERDTNPLVLYRWYTLKTCEEMLKELGADIICFQGVS